MLKITRCVIIILTLALAGSIAAAFFASDNIAITNDVTTIRFGHEQGETNERHLAAMHFKELVEEKSQGEMEVLVYPNAQLGSEPEMIESVTLNDLQMVAATAFTQYDQRISVFELPYLFDSYEQAWNVLDGEVGQDVANLLLEDNLRILAYFENGFRHVTSNRPIESPEDLNGLVIRTPEFPISLSTFNIMGANPTPMAFGELYTALQQGTVDAQENPISTTSSSNFQEVQEYLSLTSHQYMPLPVAINEEFWQSLSSKEQGIISSSAQEAAQYHRDIVTENEEKMLMELEEYGMGVVEPDISLFEEEVGPVYDSFRQAYGDELVNRVIEAANE